LNVGLLLSFIALVTEVHTFPLQQAEEAEKSQPPMITTCRGIVDAVIELDVDDEDRKRTWKADAEASAARGSIETARAIYEHALKVFPGKKSIWRAAASLEKAHGTRESLDELLKRAVKYCPQVVSKLLLDRN
jgi:pre-mRNA-processing factor 6